MVPGGSVDQSPMMFCEVLRNEKLIAVSLEKGVKLGRA
jgi:hypothetical protein